MMSMVIRGQLCSFKWCKCCISSEEFCLNGSVVHDERVHKVQKYKGTKVKVHESSVVHDERGD